MAMMFAQYVEEKLSANLEDAHTRHLSQKVENSLAGLSGSKPYTLAEARKELDLYSIKVSKTGFGMFQQAIENKAAKPTEEATHSNQPNKPRGLG